MSSETEVDGPTVNCKENSVFNFQHVLFLFFFFREKECLSERVREKKILSGSKIDVFWFQVWPTDDVYIFFMHLDLFSDVGYFSVCPGQFKILCPSLVATLFPSFGYSFHATIFSAFKNFAPNAIVFSLLLTPGLSNLSVSS